MIHLNVLPVVSVLIVSHLHWQRFAQRGCLCGCARVGAGARLCRHLLRRALGRLLGNCLGLGQILLLLLLIVSWLIVLLTYPDSLGNLLLLQAADLLIQSCIMEKA